MHVFVKHFNTATKTTLIQKSNTKGTFLERQSKASEAYLEPCQRSQIELYAKIVNG